jgi:hypothetical protein
MAYNFADAFLQIDSLLSKRQFDIEFSVWIYKKVVKHLK